MCLPVTYVLMCHRPICRPINVMLDLNSFTVLDAIDLPLMLAGGIILLIVVARYLHHPQGHRDPLRGSPLRTNKLSLIWVWLTLLAYFTSALIGNALVSVYTVGGSNADLDLWRSIIAGNIHQVIVIAATLAIASQTFTAGMPGLGIGRQSFARDIAGAVLVLLVSLCVCNLLGWATEALFRAVSPQCKIPPHPVFTVLSMPYSPLFIHINTIIGAVLFAPIGEELLFRGILQTGFHKIFPARHHSLYHRWASIVCVATLFGLMHWGTPQNVPALIVLGVLLGYLYERTGSLLAPIYLHMLFNSKSVLWFYLGGQ